MSEFGKDFSDKTKDMSMKELMQMIGDIMRDMQALGGVYVINVPIGKYSEEPMVLPEGVRIGAVDLMYPLGNADPRDFREDHTGQIWSEYNQRWVWL